MNKNPVNFSRGLLWQFRIIFSHAYINVTLQYRKHLLSGLTEMLNLIIACPISPSAVLAIMTSICEPASNLLTSMEISRAPVHVCVRVEYDETD